MLSILVLHDIGTHIRVLIYEYSFTECSSESAISQAPLFSAKTIGRIVSIEPQPLTHVTQGPPKKTFSTTIVSYCTL